MRDAAIVERIGAGCHAHAFGGQVDRVRIFSRQLDGREGVGIGVIPEEPITAAGAVGLDTPGKIVVHGPGLGVTQLTLQDLGLDFKVRAGDPAATDGKSRDDAHHDQHDHDFYNGETRVALDGHEGLFFHKTTHRAIGGGGRQSTRR
jgi:hypothetical protein